MAIPWDSKILLAKIETTYGADAAPTAAANAVLAKDVTITPMEGSDVSRGLELPTLGAQATIPTELHQRLSFKVELAPSGVAGTPPAWGPLLRGCAIAETIAAGTSVTYNPVSDGHESLTFHLWIGGTRYALLGSRGTVKLTLAAQTIPYLEFEFTGFFTQPAEIARANPMLTAFKKPNLATTANTPTFTMDAITFVMRSFSMNIGNQVENRFLIGSENVLITQKAELIETTVEAQALTAFNPFLKAGSQAQMPVNLVHGVGAGKVVTLAVPAAQMQRPQGLENAQGITEWPLRLVPLAVVANDQWTLTLT